jgi:undecaprenyl pyrophosphate phosphatase UppP
MAVIVIAGTGLLEAVRMPGLGFEVAPGHVWAFVAALASGIVAIRFLVLLLRQGRFHLFAPYCATIGVATLTWAVFFR